VTLEGCLSLFCYGPHSFFFIFCSCVTQETDALAEAYLVLICADFWFPVSKRAHSSFINNILNSVPVGNLNPGKLSYRFSLTFVVDLHFT
jgi:hypothetical protein